jgi:hypothetical protein
VWSPCNFPIEYYTEIFYAIYKWSVPSIQCKKSLRWSNSMRVVECPSLVFVDFNVTMLTPGRVGVFWECSPPWALSSAKRARLLKSQSYIATDGRSISKSWCRAPRDIYYCLTVLFLWGAPLMRGWVCLLYILLALASTVFLGSESIGTRDHILLSHFWDGICIPPCPHTGMQW